MNEEPEFKSLNYLRNAIKYLLEVMAALSILLLTIGLVSASWNFLDKDGLFGHAPWLQSLWGLDQALAIDANLPLVFVYLFASIKHRDWVKAGIYTLIGAMLLFVAATILDMESLRQALNISLDSAALQVHVSMGVITQVRSFATIGLVAMSGLTWTMLLVKKDKKLAKIETHVEPAPVDPAPLSAVPAKHAKPKSTGSSNGHTPTEDKYKRYQELIAVTPKDVATIPWLVKQLGVAPSTISNYRRKSKNNDELTILQPTPEEANA